jgi:citrate lyase subunit beta/citryl-CoA lyase
LWSLKNKIMAKKIAVSGNDGPKVRSDCHLSLQISNKGDNEIIIKSKVASLFGDDILSQLSEMLDFFEIKGAKVEIIDKGALPFVIAARLEAAIKQLVKTDKEYLLPIIEENKYSTKRDIFRFTRLYLPGNTPSMMLNAGLHSPNGIILDLEDSVAPAKKNEARLLVRNALRSVNFYGAERMVRINQGKMGIEDLDYIIPHNVNLILVPKCESAKEIHVLENRIQELKKQHNISSTIYFMPIIESAMGVEKAFEIATASENVVSLAIGLEDFTADLGTMRTQEGEESKYARWRLVNAAKAARIQPIDSVYSDVANMDGLRETVKKSKALGFEGMGCIHPRQIPVIKECFAPEEKELEKAMKIVNAAIEAEKQGLGVISLGSKMIDPPVVKRAERTINLAISMGLINKNWREEYVN